MERVKRVVFIQIGTGIFAIEIDQIKRFAGKVEISDFADRDKNFYIAGLICLYDELIPVLNIYKWFDQKPVHFSKDSIFVVLMFGDKSIAFPIDAVIGCCEVSDECFHTVPALLWNENKGVFREVINWNGKLYLKISSEILPKEMMKDIERLGENTD